MMNDNHRKLVNIISKKWEPYNKLKDEADSLRHQLMIQKHEPSEDIIERLEVIDTEMHEMIKYLESEEALQSVLAEFNAGGEQ